MNQEDSVVYVVDDDPSLRGAIDSLLRSVGWRVQTFVSARDFLDSKPQDRHACLVLDVALPGLSGLDLQSELIKNKIQVPVIFITGHADVPTSVRAMKAGAVEFLTKPFDDEDLLEAIRQAIEHDRTTREQHRDHQEELAAAARIQQGLMAVTALQPPFAEALGKSQPCREIVASLLQGMIHEGLLSNVPLPEIARNANEFFCVRDLGSKYATLVIVCVKPDGQGEYLNCGHIPPFIARAGGEVTRLRESNLPVGLMRNAEYRRTSFRLNCGDRLILVTDGVTEAESPEGDVFGEERLEAFISLGMSLDQIFTSVCLFQDGRPLGDDCTLVGLDYVGLNYVGTGARF
jgi:FixJ family two-component response regulator